MVFLSSLVVDSSLLRILINKSESKLLCLRSAWPPGFPVSPNLASCALGWRINLLQVIFNETSSYLNIQQYKSESVTPSFFLHCQVVSRSLDVQGITQASLPPWWEQALTIISLTWNGGTRLRIQKSSSVFLFFFFNKLWDKRHLGFSVSLTSTLLLL